jgi:hypothetical protein
MLSTIAEIIRDLLIFVGVIDAHLQHAAKIVGVSNELDKVQRCEADARAAFGSIGNFEQRNSKIPIAVC